MKKFVLLFTLVMLLAFTVPAAAAEFAFHGDLNHRFAYTNHNDWLRSLERGVLDDGTVDDQFGEIKYRLWVSAATNDNNVKGVFATEIGGLRFGEDAKAEFSGDQIKMEVRWAYVDFQLPGVENKARFKVGLMPFKVNPYLWQETVGGVNFDGSAGDFDYQLAWARGHEIDVEDDSDNRSDVDSFLARINTKPIESLKSGFFVLYQTHDEDADSSADFADKTSRDYEIKTFDNTTPAAGLSLISLGADGAYTSGNFFIKYDLIYQTGEITDISFDDSEFSGVTQEGDFDVSAYFAHLDLGYKMGKTKFTYTFWYASGDDDPNDDQFDAYIATDVDRADSITIMEGNYADDNYFTEKPYILDKGFIMNKLALDYQATDKLTLGAAAMYMMTAEDIEYTDSLATPQSNNDIGVEINGYFKYMIYKNLEFAVNAGYLFAGDAMDAFEVDAIKDGSSDENIFIASSRIRYKF